jgi:hypothetical protein
MTSPNDPHLEDPHLDVGAYVLGILDPEDRERFEQHLAGCPQCIAEAGQLGGLEPLLAELAATGGVEPPRELPDGQVLENLITEVSVARRRGRIRRLVLAACASLLILGGPAATFALTEVATQQVAVAQEFSATDPGTGVSAKVGVSGVTWGSQVKLDLSNITGPRTCDLVAVSHTGVHQTVSTWSVPLDGYSAQSLHLTGGAAMSPSDIDHFEVRDLSGSHQLLVSVPVHA